MIGLGLPYHLFSSSKGQLTSYTSESYTVQLPGLRLQALWVATQGKKIALLRVTYPPAEMQSAYSTAPNSGIKQSDYSRNAYQQATFLKRKNRNEINQNNENYAYNIIYY